jgi:hypothetical protein
MSTTQFLKPGIAKSEVANFCFCIAQYFPVPEIAGT